jgi:hypothetical protein
MPKTDGELLRSAARSLNFPIKTLATWQRQRLIELQRIEGGWALTIQSSRIAGVITDHANFRERDR